MGKLYTIPYGIVGSTESLLVATTRPETMFGDVAIAVHPIDERYRHLQGGSVRVPFIGRVCSTSPLRWTNSSGDSEGGAVYTDGADLSVSASSFTNDEEEK